MGEEDLSGWRALLGRKVSVRYRLHGDPRHQFSEAIGVVMGIETSERGELIKILTRRGEQVVVNADDIVARKTFPTS
ncbi:MAG: hypothetical protein KY391_01980 [Actinobacteria bacterium]|nr:hypothetical protein [Actinomycetota bacterium]